MKKDGTIDTKTKAGKQKKRTLPDNNVSSDDVSRTRPRRAAACTNFKERSVRISGKSEIVSTRKHQIVEDEFSALEMTSLPSDKLRETMRLTSFILYTNGVAQPVEMLEVDNIFISSVILPLEECVDKEKQKVVRFQSFGRVENWNISGYEDGSPVIWIATSLADYDCLKPATSYKRIYDYFFAKASASLCWWFDAFTVYGENRV